MDLFDPYGPTGSHVFLRHDLTTYASGKVVSTCRSVFEDIERTSTTTYVDGTTSAYCSVPGDFDAQSGGVWTFSMTQDWSKSLVTYVDPNSTRHGWQTAADCSL